MREVKTLDSKGVADMLKVHPETAKEILAKGEIPAAKIGRSWVAKIEDVSTYLDKKIMEQTGALLAKRKRSPLRNAN